MSAIACPRPDQDRLEFVSSCLEAGKHLAGQQVVLAHGQWLGPEDTRKLLAMRRTGAVKANAGGAFVDVLAAKMGTSIDQSRKLQKRTCQSMPQRFEVLTKREERPRTLSEEHHEFKKLKLGPRKKLKLSKSETAQTL